MAAVVSAGCALAAAGLASAGPAMRATAAQTAQLAAGSGYGPAAVLAGMSEGQRVGQLFMAGVAATGPVSSQISSDISTYHTGSVILTGRSTAGVGATRTLTNQLQGLATGAATDGVPLFVATDQEGGNVQVLSGSGFSVMPTALSQGTESPTSLLANADTWGGQLAAAGVNLNLAPVLDTVPANLTATNQPIGVFQREYGTTPTAVTAAGTAFIQGMHEAGISTAIKHFPGLGRATGNTDTTFGVTDNVTTYNDPYLQPYSAAVHLVGAQVVMVSEAIYTKVDAAHQAVFSPTVIGGMLRGELGFHGVIMSDSMDATAVDELTPAQRAVDFINAGGDLVLATSAADIPAMYNAVLAQAQSSSSFASLVNNAALTVLIAKEQTGLTGGTAAVAATSGGQPTVVERASGGSVVAFTQSSGTWTGPVPLSGQTGYQPAAAAIPGTTTIEAAAVGLNGLFYVQAFTPGATPPGWSSLGGSCTSPPAIAAGTGGQLAAAVRGPHNTLYVNTYAPGQGWSGWASLGGQGSDAPMGVTFAPSGDLDVFVTGTAGTVYENSHHAGTWSGWMSLGGKAVGGPAAVTVPGGPVEIFVQGPGGVVYEKSDTTSWSAWLSLGGVITTSPAAASPAAGQTFVAAGGTDGGLWQDNFSNGTWSGWQLLPFD